MRFLVVEDEPEIRRPLVASLREAGYAVDEAGSAGEARELAVSFPFDALMVDVGLPEGPLSGFELVQELRAQGRQFPVLFLTARDAVEDRIAGLDSGGDDYLVKPFHLGEVQARLRALVRRGRVEVQSTRVWRDLNLDWTARAVFRAGQRVALTAKEFALLEVLASHPGRVYTREELIDRVWDGRFDAESNVVDTYVRNLRRKLGDDVVRTLRGLGYSFPEGE
ncbi:response regulator transcription factor (plasmid) [Deinococcus metallilatus]|uniref:Two-component system response regulator PhoP n=1 Tax=Deinococcus metallilatus TaxID=1211322 RepID=A0ABR6MV14_9DEIO|nr:response regulator transcription factor [Deinococcus metallilatus]MBB5295758.1 two-component system response regulator PhoP [Deinococcus metallilatus]QBY06801.1 response regulator transcription factor [Deinococcus metallilatus]GMA14287.1 response regulator [Deinococcus metallilatus]